MSEYYAVVRSTDHLAHYGVKGMKWGVKKAIASGSSKQMDRAYKKAQKHLRKLQTRANIDAQKANVGVQSKKAVRSGLATAGVGGIAALTRPRTKATGAMSNFFTFNPSTGKTERVTEEIRNRVGGGVGHYVSGGLTAAGAAKTAYHAGKAIASKYRTTKRGHEKAVAKADAWKKEMDAAFAGTKYGKRNLLKSVGD